MDFLFICSVHISYPFDKDRGPSRPRQRNEREVENITERVNVSLTRSLDEGELVATDEFHCLLYSALQ